jgi:type III secretory pathway component EscS
MTPILNMIFALMAIDFTTLMHSLKLVSLVYCLSLTYSSLGMCKAHYSMNTKTQLTVQASLPQSSSNKV